MSNTMKPNEIDEVMSSVRKLVSKSERMTDDPEGLAENEPWVGERLILTPALRVDKNVDAPAADIAEPEQSDNVLVLDPETEQSLPV